MGRMKVGRFGNRAEAIDFLCAKYPLGAKERAMLEPVDRDAAQYTIREREGHSLIVFKFSRTMKNGRVGLAQYSGSGADLTEAVTDLFKQLDESIEAEASNA